MKHIWKPVNHPDVLPGYLVSDHGMIRSETLDESKAFKPTYRSSNGYDFSLLFGNDITLRLFPIDEIIGYAFVEIPKDLIGKAIRICHLNGDTRDISIENLKWVEDIEEWRKIEIDELKSQEYQISSWGRVKNPEGKILNCIRGENSYVLVTLRKKDGKRKQYSVHRLSGVAFGLLPDYYSELFINHIDGIKLNNYWKNIEAVTQSENNHHALLTGLRTDCINVYEIEIIKEELMQSKGKIMPVVNKINDNKMFGNKSVTEAIVQNIKSNMKKAGYNFEFNMKRKVSKKAYKRIKNLLIKHDGNCKKVAKIIQQDYPEISRFNISSVRAKLQKEGYTFKNFHFNIKITENERAELLKILKENDLSPSKAYRVIENSHEFPNVTIYDIKHLKRQYLKNVQ